MSQSASEPPSDTSHITYPPLADAISSGKAPSLDSLVKPESTGVKKFAKGVKEWFSSERSCPLSLKGIEYFGSKWDKIDDMKSHREITNFLRFQATIASDLICTSLRDDKVKSAAWKEVLGLSKFDHPDNTGKTTSIDTLMYANAYAQSTAEKILEWRRNPNSGYASTGPPA